MIFDFITKAKEMFYSNAESKMKADNVQDALDEVNEKANNCYTKTETNALFTSEYETNIVKKTTDAGMPTTPICVGIEGTRRAGWGHITFSDKPIKSLEANVWVTVARLKEEYRPKHSIPFTWFYGGSISIGYLYTDGQIRIYPMVIIDLTEGLAININVVYPLMGG